MPLRNIEKEHRQPSLILHLSNPETYNAFSLDMAQALRSTIEMMRPQALILTHRGRIFCSGGNLKAYAQLKSKEEGLHINSQIKDILDGLEALAIPKVAVVDGQCFGGGLELLGCFDHIIATPKSAFGLWQRKIGLSYGWGGQKRLERRIGSQRLKEWYYGANLKNSYECRRWGLVDRIALRSEAIALAEAWNHRVLQMGSESLKVTNKSTEAEAFSELWMGEKHQAALKKFQ